MKNRNIILTTMLLTFAWLAPLPKMQAVVPAPDGGYPGGNTAEGQAALLSLNTSDGLYNTAVGIYSLLSLTDGDFCTGVGAGTLLSNTANYNTATGAGALLSNTTGQANTANGAFALFSNTEGGSNTAIGDRALFSNATSSANTAVGASALFNTRGNFNIAVGYQALGVNTTGNQNTALGFNAGLDVTTANNVICIGASVFGANLSNSCYIGNIFDATAVLGSAVFVSADNKLGTITSSKRFKQDIKPINAVSEALYKLTPVKFRYKKEIDPAGTSQFGLVAEEVEKVNPDLVVRDQEGKPYSVRYDAVNAMLLNEFLKEHRKVQEQEASIAQMKKGMDALVARIKEQDSKIQKVSDRIEMSKAPTQVATIK